MNTYTTTEQEQQEKTEFYQLVEMLESVAVNKNLTQLEAAEFSRIYKMKIGG